MINELSNFGDHAQVSAGYNSSASHGVGLSGRYHVVCHGEDGILKWEEDFENQVDQVGKILMLTAALQATTTLVGPYLGLVSGSSNTFSPTDTMASHAGWTEFVNYTVSGSAVRGTAVFGTPTGNGSSTSGSNVVTATATGIVYTITGAGGTVGGCFLVFGSGAVNTQSSTGGTLYSAGAFAVPKAVTAGDTVTVTYSTTATS